MQSTLFLPTLDTTTNSLCSFDCHETFVQDFTLTLKLLKIKPNYLILQKTYVLDTC